MNPDVFDLENKVLTGCPNCLGEIFGFIFTYDEGIGHADYVCYHCGMIEFYYTQEYMTAHMKMFPKKLIAIKF